MLSPGAHPVSQHAEWAHGRGVEACADRPGSGPGSALTGCVARSKLLDLSEISMCSHSFIPEILSTHYVPDLF